MIHIITPCHRTFNLDRIKQTIPKECNWIIVFDSSVEPIEVDGAVCMESGLTGAWGARNRNYALDNYEFDDNDWIANLDSDNILHGDWYSTVKNYLDSDAAMITWGQLSKNGEKRLNPTSRPAVGNIDTGSFMVKWKYVKDIRYSENYTHDGEYAKECSTRGELIVIESFISFYNYL